MRLHHMLWHTARNGWLRFSPAARLAFERIGWEPPRPALDRSSPIYDNESGEDFFYMHHQMIEEVNHQLAKLHDPGYPKVVGWNEFPAPDNTDYPVPPGYSLGDPSTDAWLRQVKTDSYFFSTFLPQAKQLEDPKYLASISLGELGARVEFSVHNWAHMRWSEKPSAIRPDPEPTTPTAVDKKWDPPAYNWLGDFYSSHVNPLFWKLHGWVDKRIDAWKQANGISGEYHWKGTWAGKMVMGSKTMHEHLEAAVEAGSPSPELAAHAAEGEELLKVAAGDERLASPFLRVELRNS